MWKDDDYYYYVKAVPKINLAVPERNVKKISANTEAGFREVTAEPEEENAYEPELSEEERYAMGEELEEGDSEEF